MTDTMEQTVPYGMRAMEWLEQAVHPAEDCHIDPETQLITTPAGELLAFTMSVPTATTSSKTNKHNGVEEWGSDDT